LQQYRKHRDAATEKIEVLGGRRDVGSDPHTLKDLQAHYPNNRNRPFLCEEFLAHYLGKGGYDKGLRPHLHHIWPRGKPLKLIRVSPFDKACPAPDAPARARGLLMRATGDNFAATNRLPSQRRRTRYARICPSKLSVSDKSP
jgi:hypothetical protein